MVLFTKKKIRGMQGQGQIPKQDWNDVAANLNSLQQSLKRPRAYPIVTFSLPGLLVKTGANICGKLRVERAFTIVKVVVYIEVTSSSGSVDVDINQSANPNDVGTTLYSSNPKPSIPASSYEDLTGIPDDLLIEKDQYLSVDLDGVGTGAESLTVILYGK